MLNIVSAKLDAVKEGWVFMATWRSRCIAVKTVKWEGVSVLVAVDIAKKALRRGEASCAALDVSVHKGRLVIVSIRFCMSDDILEKAVKSSLYCRENSVKSITIHASELEDRKVANCPALPLPALVPITKFSWSVEKPATPAVM